LSAALQSPNAIDLKGVTYEASGERQKRIEKHVEKYPERMLFRACFILKHRRFQVQATI
jgi:hypothetical protein